MRHRLCRKAWFHFACCKYSVLGLKQASLGDRESPKKSIHHRISKLDFLLRNFLYSNSVLLFRTHQQLELILLSLPRIHANFLRKPENAKHHIYPPMVRRAHLSSHATVNIVNRIRERWSLLPEMSSLFHNAVVFYFLAQRILLISATSSGIK